MINAIIIEDSRLARLELKELLSEYDWINIQDEAENIEQAHTKISSHNPQLLFLDINLPEGDAFDLLNELDVCPYIIFTTAYNDYALTSFDYNTIDYLLKPIKPQHLQRALEKARQILMTAEASSNRHDNYSDSGEDVEAIEDIIDEAQKIFVKDGDAVLLLQLSEVYMMESIGNHSRLFTSTNQPLLLKSLNAIEKRLDPKQFIRINRQQIINMRHIKSVELWFGGKLKLTLENGTEVEVSRRNSQEIKKRFCF